MRASRMGEMAATTRASFGATTEKSSDEASSHGVPLQMLFGELNSVLLWFL